MSRGHGQPVHLPHAGHGTARGGRADRRWLLAALVVVTAFMLTEFLVGLAVGSLALLADAGHMLTDAAALALAVGASRLAERPARGVFTYGFARVDALSGQANGITLLLLAIWVTVEAVRRLIDPGAVGGGAVAIVAALGVLANGAATWLAGHASREGLNVRGVLAHLITDVWGFAATLVAGLVVLTTGWSRADAVASLLVAVLMIRTGAGLVRASGRVFLEAAPAGVDPGALGDELAGHDGVAEVHDLHVWVLGSSENALSAHVLVDPAFDCHQVAERLRRHLVEAHGIGHVTLQVDHADRPLHDAAHCEVAHGEVHVSASYSRR